VARDRQPLQELARQVIRDVCKATSPEEALLYPADEVFDRTFLLRTPGRAQLDHEAVVDRHLRQCLIPDRAAVLVTPRHHRLRIIKHHTQRHTARVLEAQQQ
jgi:hypothetical protein